jgi:hypothetical protein
MSCSRAVLRRATRRGLLAGAGGAVLAAVGARLRFGKEDGVASAQSTSASTVGAWSAVQTWPLIAIHAAVLPTGKVITWASKDATYLSPSFGPYIFDPTTGSLTPSATPNYDTFCSGCSFMPDGRLFVAGGHNGDNNGVPYASIYDPFGNSWTQLPVMNAGRWYPTTTTLATGDMLVQVGVYKDASGTVLEDDLPQIWQNGPGAWWNLTTGGRFLWYYPWMYVAPNGKIFHAGPMQDTEYLDTSGTGAWTPVALNNVGYRDRGSSAMYAPGKILIVGGNDPPTAAAEIIDLNAASPAWQLVQPMANARRQCIATLLPDGKVLVIGGSSGGGFDNASYPVYTPELWDPATATWTTMAAHQMYRGYHATAFLLPDGRVVCAGGTQGGPNAEIYSPPYLFKGARPTITSAPARVTYGQTFRLQTPDLGSVTTVRWLRLSAITHCFDQNQRVNVLPFVKATGALNVTAPASPTACPPGHYMLFILNKSSIPSVASIIAIA